MKRLPGTSGFTLVEVMIALGIMSFELLAVIAMFTSSLKADSYAMRLTSATSLAQTRMEQAKTTSFLNLVDLAAGDECFNYQLSTADCAYAPSSGESPQTVRDNTPIYTRATTVEPDTPVTGMTRVGVLVSWTDDSGNTHSTTVITAISRY